MPLFKYAAVNDSGHLAKGELDATNDADLELRLERMGLTLIQYTEKNPRARLSFGKSISRKDIINFCFDMEQLSRSGVPLLQGLMDIRDSTENPRLREMIGSAVNDIEGGKLLSESLASYPQVFDEVFVSLIRAGEESGTLPDIFRSLTSSLKWQDELVAKTKKILFYPVMVSVVVGGVTIFLMSYLVPKLKDFIFDMGGDLPGYSLALFATSDFIADYWYWLLFSVFLAWASLMIALQLSRELRYYYDLFKIRVWILGPLLEKLILARLMDLFAIMYRAGLPILDIIEIARGATGNLVINGALERAGENISQGNSISAAFTRAGIFPPLVNRMIRVGETTGELDKSLVNVSYFFNREAEDRIDRLQAMLGPVVILILGGIMAWIMMSVIFPIYDLMGQIQA